MGETAVKYVSTRGKSPAAGFEDVLLAGLAPDGGLYVPAAWPKLSAAEIRALRGLDYAALAARVVSMPSSNVFDRQDASYRDAVLPRGVPRVAVEAGVTDFWRKYVGLDGAVVGIDRFGESAPAGELFKHFGFTAQHVAEAAKGVLQGKE